MDIAELEEWLETIKQRERELWLREESEIIRSKVNVEVWKAAEVAYGSCLRRVREISRASA